MSNAWNLIWLSVLLMLVTMCLSPVASAQPTGGQHFQVNSVVLTGCDGGAAAWGLSRRFFSDDDFADVCTQNETCCTGTYHVISYASVLIDPLEQVKGMVVEGEGNALDQGLINHSASCQAAETASETVVWDYCGPQYPHIELMEQHTVEAYASTQVGAAPYSGGNAAAAQVFAEYGNSLVSTVQISAQAITGTDTVVIASLSVSLPGLKVSVPVATPSGYATIEADDEHSRWSAGCPDRLVEDRKVGANIAVAGDGGLLGDGEAASAAYGRVGVSHFLHDHDFDACGE